MTRRILLLLALPLLSADCMGPNYARISNELRAKNNQLQDQLDHTQQEKRDLNATIALLHDQLDARTPRVATLPQERLDQLFTVGKVLVQNGTDLYDSQHDGKLDSFRVYIQTQTADSVTLPATGTLTIDAFDLDLPGPTQRLGHWTFTPTDLKKLWYRQFGLDHYALNCPLASLPPHNQITFRIHFIDALTNQALENQKMITIHLPPAASAPTSKPQP